MSIRSARKNKLKFSEKTLDNGKIHAIISKNNKAEHKSVLTGSQEGAAESIRFQ